jgi:hypothetical protein
MISSRLITIIGLMILVLSACTSGDEGDGASLIDDVAVKSIDEIVESELLVTNFANDGTATLPIQSSIPVACTIVYGTTPDFGSLSLDQDMAGGTHSDHSPLLSGLEPETEYYYRVQGVDVEGVIYLSEVMTFTTPAFEESTTQNLASPEMGAEIAGFSSAFGDAGVDDRWGAGSAFDDSPNSEWSSAGDGDEAWIEVKLAQPARIDSVAFHSRAMADGSAITRRFTITTDAGEVLGPFDLASADIGYNFEVDVLAEILRFDLVETTGGNTGAVDIAVYGEFVGE